MTPRRAGRQVLFLRGGLLRELLTLDVVVPAIEEAYVAHSAGAASLYPVVREMLPEGAGVFGIKSGIWPVRDALGLKVAGYWPGNHDRGLDNHQATVVLVEPSTGVARTIMDGNWITAVRTAAAGAIGLARLARPEATRAVLVGTGVQGEAQARALHWWHPGIEIGAFEPIDEPDGSRARAFATRLAGEGLSVRPVADPEAAIRRADVVVTATPSRAPLVRRAWLADGTHINAMGADTRGKQEHEVATLRDAHVVVDDWRQASTLGECQHAVGAGLDADIPPNTIGEVIAGSAPGRRSPGEVTLFDATGLALQDLAAAELADRLARQQGRGTMLSLE